jgi:hypothetical protein
MLPSGEVGRFQMDSLSSPPGDFRRSPTGGIVNPYDAPASNANNVRVDEPKNPAKPLLIFVGGLYAAISPFAILSGLQAGLHLVVAGIAMLVLGFATIWLALRDFNALFRNVTIVWGCCFVAFFALASFSAYSPSDVGGLFSSESCCSLSLQYRYWLSGNLRVAKSIHGVHQEPANQNR